MHERYDSSTCNESFALDDSVASAEEYVGLLGKEYAKDQERRLTMDLTKLKNDAASVTPPPPLSFGAKLFQCCTYPEISGQMDKVINSRFANHH